MSYPFPTATPAGAGPIGQQRSVGKCILLYIVTLGFYGLYWSYKIHDEMKKHTGDGLGGVLGLVVWYLISPVSAFVIPSEINGMYQKAGKTSPVRGITGLWLFPGIVLIVPAIIWFVKVQNAMNAYWAEAAAAPAPASAGDGPWPTA